MRSLLLSDIHSNLEALKSVIKDSEEQQGSVDQLWVLGDLVGYGPDPVDCIELVQQYDTIIVAGNHDLAAVGEISIDRFNPYAKASTQWTSTQIGDDHRSYIRSLPLKLVTRDFTMVHGSPRDPIWEYLVTPTCASQNFEHFETARCLVGHSHIPQIFSKKNDYVSQIDFVVGTPLTLTQERMIINPGGVGQPRDGDPRSNYAIYDSSQDSVTHHRVEYDIPTTQKKMIDRGLPIFLADRLATGR